MTNSAAEPTVCVITTLLDADRGQFEAAATSIASQTFRDFEWVIHECGPRGCAEDVLSGFDLPHVHIERDQEVISLAAGRNRAIEKARGKLLAIFDGDDVCDPSRLERQVRHFAAHPEVDVLGGAIECIDSDDRSLGYRAYPATHEGIIRLAHRQNPMAHPTVMMRRTALSAVGGYRDYGEGACDDYELWSRMLKHGAHFANLKEVVLRYRMHAGTTKSRRLRATLRDTLQVKRDYWSEGRNFGDRLRTLGERMLLGAPPKFVNWCFGKVTLRKSLRQERSS